MEIKDVIPNAAYPTGGQGLVLDTNGALPLVVRQSLPGYRFYGDSFTSPVSITATTDATANAVITMASAAKFDGVTSVKLEFFCPRITPGSDGRLLFVLFENGSPINRLADIQLTSTSTKEVYLKHEFVPGVGFFTYGVNAFVTAGTGTVSADVGGATKLAPGTLRVVRA